MVTTGGSHLAAAHLLGATAFMVPDSIQKEPGFVRQIPSENHQS
jgi:hypothetical protein